MQKSLGDDKTIQIQIHRRRHIKHIFSLLIILSFVFGQGSSASLILPVDQVKPGMKGKGKTVFLENAIEEFDVEVLGVLENVQPKKNIILARLSGKGLETTGIIQGMSGSPVYIEGKLIGAIAFSFAFSREPIAGITPIGEMLTAEVPKEKAKPAQTSLPLSFPVKLSIDDLMSAHGQIFSARPSLYTQGQTLQPIGVPLILGGFSSTTMERTKPLFARLGFHPVSSGTESQISEKIPPSEMVLREGDPVAVQLVGGDMSAAALGTVTYRDGNKVLAFGHPLYNLGPVDYAMAKAKILAIVPSLESSFKLATTGVMVGSFSQDRTSGVFGETGKMSHLIPLNLRFLKPEGGWKEFKLELANDKILSPLLLNVTLSSILSSEQRSFGDLSFDFSGDVFLDNGASVHLEDLFSGNFDAAITNLSGLLTAVVYYLANNEFETVGIHRIDVNLRSVEEVRFSSLERIWLDKYEVSPGERIQVKIYCRTFGGKSFEESVDIEAPPLPAGSEFLLVIADAASMHQVEMSQYRSQDFQPRSLAQLIRILNNLRKGNRVYFKMLASKPGLFLKGEEMPNLPPSMKSMFASPRAAASAPTELTRSTLREYQLPIPFVFRGMASLPVKIKK